MPAVLQLLEVAVVIMSIRTSTVINYHYHDTAMTESYLMEDYNISKWFCPPAGRESIGLGMHPFTKPRVLFLVRKEGTEEVVPYSGSPSGVWALGYYF